ncbi:hypothetical protein C2E23DRAFT_859290 [Lenzites betulinus]|nr:hypothetical protein C2E23DRAFT_859290 [Lenzites betulinus]
MPPSDAPVRMTRSNRVIALDAPEQITENKQPESAPPAVPRPTTEPNIDNQVNVPGGIEQQEIREGPESVDGDILYLSDSDVHRLPESCCKAILRAHLKVDKLRGFMFPTIEALRQAVVVNNIPYKWSLASTPAVIGRKPNTVEAHISNAIVKGWMDVPTTTGTGGDPPGSVGNAGDDAEDVEDGEEEPGEEEPPQACTHASEDENGLQARFKEIIEECFGGQNDSSYNGGSHTPRSVTPEHDDDLELDEDEHSLLMEEAEELQGWTPEPEITGQELIDTQNLPQDGRAYEWLMAERIRYGVATILVYLNDFRGPKPVLHPVILRKMPVRWHGEDPGLDALGWISVRAFDVADRLSQSVTLIEGNVYVTREYNHHFRRYMDDVPNIEERLTAVSAIIAAIDVHRTVHLGCESQEDILLRVLSPCKTLDDDPLGFSLGGDIHFGLELGVRPLLSGTLGLYEKRKSYDNHSPVTPVLAHTSTEPKGLDRAHASAQRTRGRSENGSEGEAAPAKRRRRHEYSKEQKMEAILQWLEQTDDGRYGQHEDIADIRGTINKRATIPFPRLKRWVLIVAELTELGRTDDTADPAGRDKIVTNEALGRFLGRSADWVKMCADVQKLMVNERMKERVRAVTRGLKETSLGLSQLYERLKSL